MRNRSRNRIQSRIKLRESLPHIKRPLTKEERNARIEQLAQKYQTDKENGLDK